MTRLADAPATSRNREPILEVLKQELSACENVLEIGSGTGQHAVYFAEQMPALKWQTSDREENCADIAARLRSAGLDNIGLPLALDVLHDSDPDGAYDGIFSANTAHIMSIQAVVALFALVGRLLPEGAPFCLYGPFRIDGEFTSESNEQFDSSLKRRDTAMGIRDLEYLDELASLAQLQRTALYAMPANNFIAVWRKMATVVANP
ncbi:MAG: DUF938 domain-containing protein [Woeseia sp.]